MRLVWRNLVFMEEIPWSSRPGDLSNNPSRFLLLGNFKEHSVLHKPQTLEEVTDQIEYAINDIPLVTIQTVCRSVRRRCWECTVAEGRTF